MMRNRTFIPIIAFLLFASFAFGQFTDSLSYDFRDGTIITNGESTDGSLSLSGTYGLHDPTYGLNMKADGDIDIAVASSTTIRFHGSEYSSLNMVGTAKSEGDLGTHNTKVTNDLSDKFDFVYWGSVDTINFKTVTPGSDLYLPFIEIIPAQAGADASLVSAVKNIIYYYDFRDGSIVPITTDGLSDISMGLIDVIVGSSNAYGYNGTQHGSIFKEGNQLILDVAGNSYIKVGGCTYSNGTMSVSSATGSFDIASQDSQTATEFHADSATVDFLYVGDAGTVTIDFTGTNYVPYVEVVPVPFDVELESWVKKAGTITINGIEIGLTAGDDASSNATVTVSDGTVISATADVASIYIDLGGNALSSYTPALTGDITSVEIIEDSLKITYADVASNPKAYIITVADNSSVVRAEAGKTYIYNFADGSVLPQTSYSSLRYTTFISQDGILTMNSNTATEALQFGYHDASHGAVLFPGNSMDIIIAGDATITFTTCQYGSASDAVFILSDTSGTVLDSIDATNIVEVAAGTSSYTYTGAEGTIIATLSSQANPNAEIYIHGITIENAAFIEPPSGKIEVWDFGAEELDTAVYKNNLSAEIINSWYDAAIPVGSAGNILPSFSAGVLSWVGGGNDRLRSTNTILTRYDANTGGVTGYSGRVYVNSGANASRYMSLTLSEDDEVTIIAKTDAGGNLNFEYVADPEAQTDEMALTSDLTELNFVAKQAGTYHIFDNQGKPSYFRIYRKDASYVTITGSLDLTQAADLPADYAILFTNEAGKTWESTMNSDSYSSRLPVGNKYDLSLFDANGYIITSGTSLEVTDTTSVFDVTIEKVELFTVSGTVTGLGSEIENLELAYSADTSANKIYLPAPMIDTAASTYTVQLEPNCEYTISAKGVNDYYIPLNTITITADSTAEVAFAPKPLYNVNIDATGLTAEQLAKMSVSFTNLYEDGYVYNFSSVSAVSLRDGTYTIAYDGLDEYPVEIGLTSNLTVAGADASKTLAFSVVANWSFDDKVIADGTPAYKGLLFTGSIANEVAKGHLNTKPDATIQVPVNAGDKIRVTYYYSADFSIEGGDPFTTESNSTSTFEFADYDYTGTEAGFVTITIGSGAGTTYLTNIAIGAITNYQEVIYVGTDKEYKTINEALAAIAKMNRENEERVTVMIDPGDYEEMLVVTVANVSLINAAATPDIELTNAGVDISENAVRITSYYGHGYNYYSMGSDQKWDADVLRVNKENAYLSYENKGAGTTNGSYWNATVVISANGFEANNIIFENSFNQYISEKETDDILVMWESGSKGERPTTIGNTDVQDRAFVERAAAIAITDNVDKVILNKCRVIGRQDSFYGGTGSRIVAYKGAMMGSTDYLFGAMTIVFYKTELVMNTSDNSNDVSYLTAAQQSSGRGYLMYECTVTSAIPGIETESAYRSKPGYFGRPWQATTSEVVFHNTTIETSNFPGSDGESLILPLGWNSSLGGESALMYEYGTIENSGVDNAPYRAAWSTVLTEPTLSDGTSITTFNFTKGADDWDPIPGLIADDDDPEVVLDTQAGSSVNIYAYGNRVFVNNVTSKTTIIVYNTNGALIKSFETNTDTTFDLNFGLWIVKASTVDGQKAVKVLTR